jgi:hypothetical protein
MKRVLRALRRREVAYTMNYRCHNTVSRDPRLLGAVLECSRADAFCEWSLKQIAPSASGFSSGVANGNGGENNDVRAQVIGLRALCGWALEQKD